MDKIDHSIRRIRAALDRLEDTVAQRAVDLGQGSPEVPALQAANRDLQDQLRVLRAQAEEDALLRAEAADAVRSALSDLRGAMAARADGQDRGAPANV